MSESVYLVILFLRNYFFFGSFSQLFSCWSFWALLFCSLAFRNLSFFERVCAFFVLLFYCGSKTALETDLTGREITPASAMNSIPPANNNADFLSDALARRRAVVVLEKNSKGSISADRVSGINDNNVMFTRKDLSHRFRGETALERSRGLSHLRKGLLADSVSPRLKKSGHRRERSRGTSFLSILTKIVMLLAALIYLGQVTWRWTAGGGMGGNSPFAAFDFDGRISEVEKSLKKTAKLLQIQVDIVDKKIGSEIGTVTRELAKQVEEKGALLEKDLKNLDSRTDNLGKSLADLKDMGLLTKEELEKFWNELKGRRNLGSLDKDVDLDEIMALTRELVEKEIEKHAADGLGWVDYALASGGARVVRYSEPYVFGKANSWLAVSQDNNRVHSSAQKMLEPSFGEPGRCFPLQGSSGFVEIRLRSGIIPEAITLEHVSKSVAYDRSSAPKDCRVYGWFEELENDPSTRTRKIFVLTEFSYDLEKSNAQTFTIPRADAGIINMFRLDFTSNHGSSALTCIYRVRVHGYEPSSPAAMATHP